jgi:hypothetical protein
MAWDSNGGHEPVQEERTAHVRARLRRQVGRDRYLRTNVSRRWGPQILGKPVIIMVRPESSVLALFRLGYV